MSRATPSRTRHSWEQWQAWINAQQASGLSETVFCEQKGINPKRLSHWKRRLRQRTSPITPESARRDEWIELSLPSTRPSGWDLELDLGQGLFQIPTLIFATDYKQNNFAPTPIKNISSIFFVNLKCINEIVLIRLSAFNTYQLPQYT